MSSQKFINDMKKLFAVCAICNILAKISQFDVLDDFSNSLFRGHINLFVQSEQMSAIAFQLLVLPLCIA